MAHGGVVVHAARGRWPRIGRDAELDALEAAVERPGGGGSVVVGDVGVGKSRLVTDFLEGLAGRGVRTVLARATRSTATVPFGSFAAWTPDAVPADSTDRLHVLRTTAANLLGRDGPNDQEGRKGRLVVGVDDAHLLDEGSAALVLHLAVHTPARVVVTVRSGAPCSDAITTLWKEGLAERLDLAPLSEPDTAELLDRVLGGGVAAPARRRVWALTGGAPLYLREVVRAALEQKVLTEVDGVWRWEGEVAGSGLLRELTGERLSQLDGGARRSLELVAVGDPLPLAILARAGALDALPEAERHGLVVVDDTLDGAADGLVEDGDGRVDKGAVGDGGDGDGRPVVRLAHPLYGEVLRAGMPRLVSRRHQAALAEAAVALGWQRRDPLRVAAWWLESGAVPGPPDVFVAAARRALTLGEWRLAERLARSAERSGAGAEATLTLAAARVHLGGWGEVEGPLATLSPDTLAGDALATYTRLQAGYRSWVEGRLAEGSQALVEAAERLPAAARARSLDEAAYLALAACDLPTAARLATIAGEHAEASPEVRVRAMAVAGLAHMLEGRMVRALQVAEAGSPFVRDVIAAEPFPDNPAGLMAAAHGLALVLDGRLGDAGARTESLLADVDQRHVQARRTFTASAAARIALLQGRLAHAQRRSREALADVGAGPSSQFPAATLATAAAQLGAAGAAEEALQRAARSTPRIPICAHELGLAQAWVAAARGELSTARVLAAETARGAAAAGAWFFEMLALLDLARLGEPKRAVARLTALAHTIEGPYACTVATYARARAACGGHGDGGGLDAASDRFETMGAVLLAAEAAAGAASAHRAAGWMGSHARSVARARRLAGRCDGARTPALRDLDAEPAAATLTSREREVAELAARGASDAEIARRLVVSVRTVETHLHRAYRKLGVATRRELAAALGI